MHPKQSPFLIPLVSIALCGAGAGCGDDLPSDRFDITAKQASIRKNTPDLHRCFEFAPPIDEPQLVRRIEPLIDSPALYRFALLKRTGATGAPRAPFDCPNFPNDASYLYAWTSGGTTIDFPDGGLLLSPQDRLILRLHYDNPFDAEDSDNSGVRLIHTEDTAKARKYGIFAPGPVLLNIPPGADTNLAAGVCKIRESLTAFATLPLTNQRAHRFTLEVGRENGDFEQLASATPVLSNQSFLDTPFTVDQGDELITTCQYKNDTDETITRGENKNDEQCLALIYTTPPPESRFCDTGLDDDPDFVDYVPGICAGPNPLTDLSSVPIQLLTTDPPPLGGGNLPSGRWRLIGGTLYAPPVIEDFIDLNTLTLSAIGQSFWQDPVARLDIQINILLDLLPLSNTLSIAGDINFVDPPGSAELTPTCPSDATNETQDLQYAADGKRVTIQIRVPAGVGGLTVDAQLQFEAE